MLPKVRSGTDLRVGVELSVTVNSDSADALRADLQQVVDDLGLVGKVRLEASP
jgi:hypothetical protein